MNVEKLDDNIFVSYDFISDDELKLLSNREFVLHNKPNGMGNSYFRSFINLEIIPNYKKNIFQYLKESKNVQNSELLRYDSWMNKITTESNKNDNFHFDRSFVTFLTYINDDFSNGEFLYKDNKENIKTIYPKKGMTLITYSTIPHKVNPVTKGERYSLVTFFQAKPKSKKSLI
jgi:hypothetical protein